VRSGPIVRAKHDSARLDRSIDPLASVIGRLTSISLLGQHIRVEAGLAPESAVSRFGLARVRCAPTRRTSIPSNVQSTVTSRT